MSLLSQASMSGGRRPGMRAVFAAAEKIGKTTMLADAPRTLLVPVEQGYAGVNVMATPLITSWENLLTVTQEIVTEINAGRAQFMSVGYDSLTAVEALLFDYVLRCDKDYGKGKNTISMNASHGGYGKAYDIAVGHFRNFLAMCDLISNAGIHVLFTSHITLVRTLDPEHGEFDMYDLRLFSPKNGKTYGQREAISQWADVIGYIREPITIIKQSDKATIGMSRGQGRLLEIERSPAFVAGNRYGVRGSIALPAPPACGWNAFAIAVYNATQGAVNVYNYDRK